MSEAYNKGIAKLGRMLSFSTRHVTNSGNKMPATQTPKLIKFPNPKDNIEQSFHLIFKNGNVKLYLGSKEREVGVITNNALGQSDYNLRKEGSGIKELVSTQKNVEYIVLLIKKGFEKEVIVYNA